PTGCLGNQSRQQTHRKGQHNPQNKRKRAAGAARFLFPFLVQLKWRQNYSPRAAATSPSNNGCGRVGRDLYSGCACVATRYGWTSFGYSTNSTSFPSGDVPENTSPELSAICSR